MNYTEEFGTVNLILESEFETRGIDAFAISILKMERQIRRIFTYLIYQSNNYSVGDGLKLREVLAKNGRVYFSSFINGINKIYGKSVKEVYGNDYEVDIKLITEFLKERNKIFHGQITAKKLTRKELIDRVNIIKKWCKTIADNFKLEIDYDGFERNAYKKSKKILNLRGEQKFNTLIEYEKFLKNIPR